MGIFSVDDMVASQGKSVLILCVCRCFQNKAINTSSSDISNMFIVSGYYTLTRIAICSPCSLREMCARALVLNKNKILH